MKTTLKSAIAIPFSLALTALVAAPSLAGSLTFATNVDEFNEGVGIKEAYRRNTANALGRVFKPWEGEAFGHKTLVYSRNLSPECFVPTSNL